MNIKIKKLSENAVVPTKGTPGAAAYDVYLPRTYTIHAGRQVLPLDIAIELPYGYEAKIEPRSGFSSKGMESTAASGGARKDADVIVGKIDSDYRGNIGVIVYSHEYWPFSVDKGTRIAQLTIYKVETAEFEECEELTDTERGDGGFGSTGTQR